VDPTRSVKRRVSTLEDALAFVICKPLYYWRLLETSFAKLSRRIYSKGLAFRRANMTEF
jgi:hypothetical protein